MSNHPNATTTTNQKQREKQRMLEETSNQFQANRKRKSQKKAASMNRYPGSFIKTQQLAIKVIEKTFPGPAKQTKMPCPMKQTVKFLENIPLKQEQF